jgi:hypothetical protein
MQYQPRITDHQRKISTKAHKATRGFAHPGERRTRFQQRDALPAKLMGAAMTTRSEGSFPRGGVGSGAPGEVRRHTPS